MQLKAQDAFLSHPADLLFVQVRLEALIEMLPPFEEERVTNELEPRGKLECWILKHLLQTIGSHVAGVLCLVGIGLEVNVGLDEEDVID